MNANETFKVKTADERKAEFDAYQKKLDDKFKAQAYEIAKKFEAEMDRNPEYTEWHLESTTQFSNKIVSHLKTLYENAGFEIFFKNSTAVRISRK